MPMNNAKCELINLTMNKDNNISEDKITIFKELIIKYLLNQIKGDSFNDA